MNKTITANFDSVDMATLAVSDIKSHFHNVQSVKIHYKHVKDRHDDSDNLGYLSPAYSAMMPVMQNGPYPGMLTPLPVDMGQNSMENHVRTQNVNAEITATDENVSCITATLRQHGGRHVTVK